MTNINYSENSATIEELKPTDKEKYQAENLTSETSSFDAEINESVTANPLDLRLKQIILENKDRFNLEFSKLIDESIFEYGFSNPAEDFVRSSLQRIGPLAREWINSYFIENFRNPSIVSSILRVIAHLDYDDIAPQGITICMAALSHKVPSVREDAVRSIENWENPELLPILKSFQFHDDWLNEYVNQVILDLEMIS